MNSRVVIVGGGVAGLSAAKVLARHFKEVLLIEGQAPAQSQHLHVLLKSGAKSLERIFPGIREKLISNGCPLVDWSEDTLWENMSGRFPRNHSSIQTYSMGRRFLNELLLKELENVSNVQIFQDKVIDLVFGEKSQVMTSKGMSITTDYIVMAAGESFPLKRYIPMKSKTYPINLTYRSYVFKTSDLNLNGLKQYYFQIDPPCSLIGGVISPMENDKTMVTLIQKEESLSACRNFEDFLEKGRSIPGNKFIQILGKARPITVICVFRKKNTLRNTFQFDKLPASLILLGDAHTSLNPVFGQGMSLALLQVELLQNELQRSFSPLQFHRKAQKLVRFPFYLSLMGSTDKGILKACLRVFLKTCQKNKKLHHFFLKTLHSLGDHRRLA